MNSPFLVLVCTSTTSTTSPPPPHQEYPGTFWVHITPLKILKSQGGSNEVLLVCKQSKAQVNRLPPSRLELTDAYGSKGQYRQSRIHPSCAADLQSSSRLVGSLVVQEVCSSPRVLLTVKTATAAAASAAEGLVVAQQRAQGCAAKLC